MQFSGLEMMLISLLGSVVTAAVVRVWMGRSFVTIKAYESAQCACQAACKLQRDQLERQIAVLESMHKSFENRTDDKMDRVFRMLRALIVYSDIPKEKQQEILNDRGE